MRGFLTMAWRSLFRNKTILTIDFAGKNARKGNTPSKGLPLVRTALRSGRLIAIPRLVIALSRPRVRLKSRGISRAVSQG